MSSPLFSIVVTTKNEERHIGNCLEAIRRQDFPTDQIETIVVDNNSTDRTQEIAQQYAAKVFNLGPERSAQRNYGILEQAEGKYVVYLDADMILSPKVTGQAASVLEDGDLVGLYVPEYVLGGSFWCQVRRFERSFYTGTVIDCVRIVRRDVFKEVGGFELRLTGQEDWDLDKKMRRAGHVAVLGRDNFTEIDYRLNRLDYGSDNLVSALAKVTADPVIFHNEIDFDLGRYLGKKSYYLGRFPIYVEKWGKDDPDIRQQTSIWYRLLGVFAEDGKWRRLLTYPFLALGMYFLRFLVAWRYLLARLSPTKPDLN